MVLIHHYLHKHPLAFCESDDGELARYSNKCTACGEKPSGSFYICRLCAPPSPFFHKSCVEDISRQIEINYRPHCTFRFKGGFSSSNLPDCDFCNQPHAGYRFCCDVCDFQIGFGCVAKLIKYHKAGDYVEHFSHRHPLNRLSEMVEKLMICSLCYENIEGPSYGCVPCKFYLHDACRQFPREIRHSFHPAHYLTLFNALQSNYGIRCDACRLSIEGRLRYQCSVCEFNLHPECTLLKENKKYSGHGHPLTLFKNMSIKSKCQACGFEIQGDSFLRCVQCRLDFHVQCDSLQLPSTIVRLEKSELPPEIQHPFHPKHSLQLRKFEDKYTCKTCHSEGQGIRYQCDICHFHLHPECMLPLPNIRYTGHQEHLLKLVENISYKSQCKECGLEIQGTFFLRCVECDMDFHVQCGSLPFPPTVVYEKHEHPLALSTKAHVKNNSDRLFCSVCQEERNIEHPVYFCDTCKYYAHVRCAISEIQVDEREKLRHFSHNHLLFLLRNKRNDGTVCSACKRDIQTDSAYGCDTCEFYLHKSCAELPRERQHPFHRHVLTLPQPYARKQTKCNACHKDFGGFIYSCPGCQFHLDLDCSLLLPSIQFESHEHPLTYFKTLPDTTVCKSCMSNSPDKFNPVSYFRCVKCDFNVHLLCSSLPQIIKYGRHRHSLTLMDNFVDLADHCYDDDCYYCDVCENKRDARECVYYCAKCSFVVDVDCVITEVLCSLKEKRGDVLLRSVRQKGSKYKDIMESLTEEEKKSMERLKQEIDEELKQIKETGNEANERFLKLFSDLDKNLVQSMVSKSKIMSVERLDAGFKDDQVVKVKEYTIIPKFSELLQKLLDKYGDIGASSTLTQRLKTILLVIFGETVNSMSNTNVIDIDGDLIIKWWAYLELVHKAGFSIDFSFDHLKKVALARFVICDVISDSRSSLLYELHEQKNQLQQEIDERRLEVFNLRKQEDQLSKEIEERMERVENLKKQVQSTIAGRATDRSRSQAKLLSDALELWWKNIPLE